MRCPFFFPLVKSEKGKRNQHKEGAGLRGHGDRCSKYEQCDQQNRKQASSPDNSTPPNEPGIRLTNHKVSFQ